MLAGSFQARTFVISSLIRLASFSSYSTAFLPAPGIWAINNNRVFSTTMASTSPALKKAKLAVEEESGATTTAVTSIALDELLSSLIDASWNGCQVIRDYKQLNNTVQGNLKEAGEAKSVVTQADIDAQQAIVGGLQQVWNNYLDSKAVQIIGEEDETENTAISTNENVNKIPRTNLLDGIVPSINLQITTDNKNNENDNGLTIFVDPLDGTREFVEGRLQNVGCLIGVAYKGKAIMGAVGLPFPQGAASAQPLIHYAVHFDHDELGMVSHFGVYPPPKKENKKSSEKDGDNMLDPITVFTGDSKDPSLNNATRSCLKIAQEKNHDNKEPNHVILGGTTSKLVAVAQAKEPSIAILHFKTCYWDTCAPEALLNAMGGKVTDFFGSPLVHRPDKTYDYGNLWGVVASSKGMEDVHDTLCQQMRNDLESVQLTLKRCMGTIPSTQEDAAQAVDISRDLYGQPLTREWLEEHILQHQPEENKNAWSLKGYAVPESQAVRGLMSNGARLLLDWELKNSSKSTNNLKPPPSTAFYKRVVMSDLAHARAKLDTAPHKVVRDVRSYQVETNFLESRGCQEGLHGEAGVHVCDCYGSFTKPATGETPEEQLESRFCMLLEDFTHENGWYQEWLLEEPSSKAALKAFANMHAYFWTGSDFWKKEHGALGKELEQVVWANGGYMQPALQGYEQLEKVESGWKGRLPSFEEDLKKIPDLQNVNLEEIGPRVERIAAKVGTLAHPFAEAAKSDTGYLQKYRTIVHGDPKQSNIFFKRKNNDSKELDVGLIDFQWCGFGLAATDVAHHICAALQPHSLSYDGGKEKELLDYYYSCLSEAFVKYGVASSVEEVETDIFPRHVLQAQYEVAFLDICRMIFAYAWARWKPESEPTPSSFNRNAYNKSLPSVLWFIVRCSAILSAREKEFE